MQEVQARLPIGNIVQERYRVEALLGKGGFGAVYRVRDLRVKGNVFALKELIDPNKKERERFTFEGEVLKRLDHRSLPRVYRAFEDDANYRAYILMDYIDGLNLEAQRQKQPEKRFSTSQALDIMAPIFEAVSYLHKQRPPIVHRDIKPANIIVPEDGSEAVLVDFGIAKEYDKESTTTAIRRCSPGYGAPEQYANGTNPRTDIYGLGATLYVLLSGVVPTDAFYRMTQLGSKHTDPLEPVTAFASEVPPHVVEAIQRAMEINNTDRYASVDEFWQALHAHPIDDAPVASSVAAVLADQRHATPAAPPGAAGEATVKVRRKLSGGAGRRGAALLLLASIALLALLAGLVFGQNFLPGVVHTASTGTVVIPTSTQVSKAATHPSATPTPNLGVSPTAIPQSSPTLPVSPASSPSSANYPILVPAYTGNISDQYTSPSTDSTMSLAQIQQHGTNINGGFQVGSGLLGSGNFTGTVTSDRKIQFTVPSSYQGLLPLLFSGQVNSDGSISGSYCSYRGNNQCDKNAGGWGTWKVSPSSPSKSASSFVGAPFLAGRIIASDGKI